MTKLRIKAYTSLGLIKSKPFFDEALALPILFKSLTLGLDVHTAYLTDGINSKIIYSKPKETRSIRDTRPDWFDEYGILSISKALNK